MFEGKVVAVTGAAGGIGEAIAQRFVESGARVAIGDIDEVRITQTAKKIGAQAYVCDVSQEPSVVKFIQKVEDEFGPIDVFVSNAGVGFSDGEDFMAAGGSNAQWETSWQVNVMSAVYAARQLLPQWIKKGEGRFVLTASAAGLLHQIGSASYSSTKRAAVGFAESLAISHKDDGVNVHCLCPQYVRTNMTKDMTFSQKGKQGLINPSDVCDTLFASMQKNEFMVLPHGIVDAYFKSKAHDYNQWIENMVEFRRKTSDGRLPNETKV